MAFRGILFPANVLRSRRILGEAWGVDPIAQLAKLENRVSQLHLKDLQKGSTCPNFDKVQPEAFDEKSG